MSESRASERRGAALCALALLAAAALLLREALFSGRVLAPSDGVLRFWPWRAFFPGRRGSNYILSDQFLNFVPLARFLQARSRGGLPPYWNPYLSCGLPAWASIQAAALYPINLLLSPLGPLRAPAYAAVLKLFAAGFFTLLFVRRLGAGWTAALAAALAFSLSGFMIVWLGHPHANAACLLPALLYFAERAVAERRARAWAGFSAVCACVILGGHPPTAVHEALLVAAYLFWRTRAELARARVLAAAVASAAFGAALAGPMLAPYLSYARESATRESSVRLARWSRRLSPGTLPGLLAPKLAGDPVEGGEALGAPLGLTPRDFTNFDFSERAGWVGVVALALALVGAMFARAAAARFFAAACAVSLSWAYGLAPLPWLASLAPPLDMVNPTRLLLVFDFSAAVLAGLALEELPRLARARRAPVAAAAGLAAAAAFAALMLRLYAPWWPQMLASERGLMVRALSLFGAGVAAASAVFWTARRAPAWAPGLACVAIAAELLTLGRGYNPAVARALDYPDLPVLRRLAARPGPFRVIGLGDVLPPDTGMIYGIQDARGQDFTGLRRYERLIRADDGDFYFYSWAWSLPAALPLLDIRYALTAPGAPPPGRGWRKIDSDGMDVYENPDDPGRALVLARARTADDATTLALARAPGFDARRVLYLADGAPSPAARPGLAGTARVTRYEPDRVEVRVRAAVPAHLLLLDAYERGWSATVAGARARVLRADYAFRAVAVPRGDSLVVFRYRPPGLTAGLWLGALAALALGAAAWSDFPI